MLIVAVNPEIKVSISTVATIYVYTRIHDGTNVAYCIKLYQFQYELLFRKVSSIDVLEYGRNVFFFLLGKVE